MMTRRENKKLNKETALLDAAFDLFAKLGVGNTTIDEIVKKAGVAKGTFYLYFKDKYDILDMVVVQKTSALLRAAIEAVKIKPFPTNVDRVIFFTDYLIDRLSHDRILMLIIHKDLSLSLYRKVLSDPRRSTEFKGILDEFKQNVRCDDYGEEDTDYLLFILIEMTGAVCYSAIVNNEPTSMERMKPVLLRTIRKILA